MVDKEDLYKTIITQRDNYHMLVPTCIIANKRIIFLWVSRYNPDHVSCLSFVCTMTSTIMLARGIPSSSRMEPHGNDMTRARFTRKALREVEICARQTGDNISSLTVPRIAGCGQARVCTCRGRRNLRGAPPLYRTVLAVLDNSFHWWVRREVESAMRCGRFDWPRSGAGLTPHLRQ